MEEFVKELEQLPIERQKAIKEGLQKQILAQAVFVRDEQPTKFLAYIDDEIGKADASMFKMVQESSREGAVLGSISEIYIWNKERKKVLIGLKQEYLNITQADIEKQQPEPLQTLRKLGRKPKSFSDCILLNDVNYLPRLKERMRGLSPNAAIELIKNAINNKAIIRPPYNAFKREFPDVAKDIPESTYYNHLMKH